MLGFRVDACKHMWPSHMEAVFQGLTGTTPFIFNEVIDLGQGEAIEGHEYYHLGEKISGFFFTFQVISYNSLIKTIHV